jgi:hypothetical protein
MRSPGWVGVSLLIHRTESEQLGTDPCAVALVALLITLPHHDIDVTTITSASRARRTKSIGQAARSIEKSENPKGKEYRNDDPRAD